ncbi:hypothetical protein ACFL0I_00245 [Gemmatimonadota bacterium]
MSAMKWFALVAGLWLLFNMAAMPPGWGGVSATSGALWGVQMSILIGFVFIFLFDLFSAVWILVGSCWRRESRPEEACQSGWLLVLAVLALIGLMGAKVMVDEIARETPFGGAGGEWVILYICLTLQLAYILGVLFHQRGERPASPNQSLAPD